MEEIKLVEFDKFCSKCKYYKLDEAEEPCRECLTNPINFNSIKPTRFKQIKEDRKTSKKGLRIWKK